MPSSISPIIPYNRGASSKDASYANTSIRADSIEFNSVGGDIKDKFKKIKEYRDTYRGLDRITTLYENPNNIQHFIDPTQEELIKALILGCQPMFLNELKKETIEKYIKENPSEFL